jgi:hypothetical protein
VRNTPSTVPRKSVVNIARPKSVEPTSTRSSSWSSAARLFTSLKLTAVPSPYKARKPTVSTSTTRITRLRTASRRA